MPSAPDLRPIPIRIRHVTRLDRGYGINSGSYQDPHGPSAEYWVDRPSGDEEKAAASVVCAHCGRELRLSVLTPVGMRASRRDGARISIASAPVAAVCVALMMLSAALPTPLFILCSLLLAFPTGVSLILVLMFPLMLLPAKGVTLESDKPAGVRPDGVELPPEQQYHILC